MRVRAQARELARDGYQDGKRYGYGWSAHSRRELARDGYEDGKRYGYGWSVHSRRELARDGYEDGKRYGYGWSAHSRNGSTRRATHPLTCKQHAQLSTPSNFPARARHV